MICTMLEHEINLNLCSWAMVTHMWLQLCCLSFQVGGVPLTGRCSDFADLQKRTGNV